MQISDETAFDHLERLCRDGSVVVEVLDYHDSHSLMVSDTISLISFKRFTHISADIRLSIPSPEAAAIGLYPHVATALSFWRHDIPRDYVGSANSR